MIDFKRLFHDLLNCNNNSNNSNNSRNSSNNSSNNSNNNNKRGKVVYFLTTPPILKTVMPKRRKIR